MLTTQKEKLSFYYFLIFSLLIYLRLLRYIYLYDLNTSQNLFYIINSSISKCFIKEKRQEKTEHDNNNKY